MTHHHVSEHADGYKKHHLYLQKLKTMVVQLNIPHSPCAFCNISVKKFHSCVILKQLALLFAQHMAEDVTFTPFYPGDDDLPRFKCQHCDKMMYSADDLDLHLLMHEELTGVFDAMRDINPDYFCALCGMGRNSHTSAMKYINDGSCPDFDINKPCITRMDKDETLSRMIQDGDVDAILHNESHLDSLDTACVLCLKTFDRRKGLQQHLTVVHARHWKNAADLAIALNTRFQKTQPCYCKPVMKHKDKPNICIVFRLLRTVSCPDADNHALMTGADEQHNSELSQGQMNPQATMAHPAGTHFEDFAESQDVPDDILAQGLQQMLTPAPAPRDYITWLRAKIHDEMGATSDLNDLLTQKTREHYPAVTDLVLCLDFRDLTYAAALDDLSRRCACFETPIHPETSWKPLLTHFPDTFEDVSMYTFGEFMDEFAFAYLPMVDTLYDISSLKFRIALQQILALRSILLTQDGCGPGQAFRTTGHLGLAAGKRRRLTRDETSEETQRTTQSIHEIQRHNGPDDLSTGSIGLASRGSAEGNQHRDGVHCAPGDGKSIRHPNLDENITDGMQTARKHHPCV